MARKVLLGCGIASSLLYITINVFVAMQWEGYSFRLSNGQRVIRDRRSDATAMGSAGNSLQFACGRFRVRHLAINQPHILFGGIFGLPTLRDFHHLQDMG